MYLFPRAQLKAFAKQRLQVNKGTAIAVALVAMLLGAAGGLSANIDFEVNVENNTGTVSFAWIEREFVLSPEQLSALMFISLVSLFVLLAVHLYFCNVVTVGLRGWFLRYQRGEAVPFGELFASFRFYKAAMVTRWLADIYTFLWSWLLVIPGIVKGLSYSMADYIIYENPNIPPSRAIEMSKIMTKGYKGELFVLGLSWIGWNMLNALTFGLLGILHLNPYILTTEAAAYEFLKGIAIRTGKLSWWEFGQQPPVVPVAEDVPSQEIPQE